MKSINILASQPIHWIYIHFFSSLLPFHHIHCLSFAAPKRKKRRKEIKLLPSTHNSAQWAKLFLCCCGNEEKKEQWRKLPSVKNFRFSRFSLFPSSGLELFFSAIFCFLPTKGNRKWREESTAEERHSRKGRQRKSIWLFVSLQKYLVEINLRYRRRIPSLLFMFCRLWGFTRRPLGSRTNSENDGKSSPFFRRAQQPFHFIPFCWRQTEKSSLYSRERDVMRFGFVNVNSYSEVIHLRDRNGWSVISRGLSGQRGEGDLWRLRALRVCQRIEIRSNSADDITFNHNYTRSGAKKYSYSENYIHFHPINLINFFARVSSACSTPHKWDKLQQQQ